MDQSLRESEEGFKQATNFFPAMPRSSSLETLSKNSISKPTFQLT